MGSNLPAQPSRPAALLPYSPPPPAPLSSTHASSAAGRGTHLGGGDPEVGRASGAVQGQGLLAERQAAVPEGGHLQHSPIGVGLPVSVQARGRQLQRVNVAGFGACSEHPGTCSRVVYAGWSAPRSRLPRRTSRTPARGTLRLTGPQRLVLPAERERRDLQRAGWGTQPPPATQGHVVRRARVRTCTLAACTAQGHEQPCAATGIKASPPSPGSPPRGSWRPAARQRARRGTTTRRCPRPRSTSCRRALYRSC